MRHPRLTVLLALGLALGLALAAAAAAFAGASGGGGEKDGRSGALEGARDATARYRDVRAALEDGYAPVGACTADPKLGAMGIHYANPVLADDAQLDVPRPEVLVYEPTADGGRRLVALEYLAPDADGDTATDEDRPDLFGQPFDGPMAGHEPGQPVHYDLHVWLWRDNPSGLFAQFNPRVSCPG
jgi:hypothetical protein